MEDAKAIVELLEEDLEVRDPGLLQEAGDIVRWLGNAVDRYEMTKLLSGQYDKKGARLSISAGAGGTDAQVSPAHPLFCGPADWLSTGNVPRA